MAWATRPSVLNLCLEPSQTNRRERQWLLCRCGWSVERQRERERFLYLWPLQRRKRVIPFPFYRHRSGSSKQVGVRYERIRQQCSLSSQFACAHTFSSPYFIGMFALHSFCLYILNSPPSSNDPHSAATEQQKFKVFFPLAPKSDHVKVMMITFSHNYSEISDNDSSNSSNA